MQLEAIQDKMLIMTKQVQLQKAEEDWPTATRLILPGQVDEE